VFDFGNEKLISDTNKVSLTENGLYRYEAYNNISQLTNTIECPSSKEFSVVSSEIATITAINITGPSSNLTITIQTTGTGGYEYALNSLDGLYQDSNTFNNIPIDSYTVYVRDKNGCGIVKKSIEQNLTLEGFPKFFTPNGDGINDFWQYIPPPLTNEINLSHIFIFDQYGNFLAQIDPKSQGWDGTFNSTPLPSSDYWFRVKNNDDQEIKGHFSLKR